MGRLVRQINYPADLRKFKKSDLKQISTELRDELIDVVSETGGHLGAGLGVVELTVALHYVFDTPKDKLVWDVSHQCYPHKIITGRKDKIKTLRKAGGLSGFTKRTESEYDPFGAAHSSTSISSTLGMSVAKKLSNNNNNVVTVIGDGAMSAGMAYEAMNNAGALKSKLIVILNDNDMSIARPVGAMSNYLAKLLSGKLFNFCLYSVGVIAKKNKKEIFYLSNLGEEIGLLFQLADDFLDIKSSKKLTGKTIGKDSKKGKSTLLNIMGYEKAYTYANNLKKKILLKLKKHGKKAKDLSNSIEFILGRNF